MALMKVGRWGVGFYLSSERGNATVYAAQRHEDLVPPRRPQDLRMRDGTSGPLHQEFQHTELLPCELHLGTISQQLIDRPEQ